MNTDLDHDPEEQASAPAVDPSGAPHYFQGKPLQLFSTRRQIAAEAMGNRLLTGRAKVETYPCECSKASEAGKPDPHCQRCTGKGVRFSSYDGFFADAVAVIYLCSQPVDMAKRAVRQPAAVLDQALDWAEEQALDAGSEAYDEAATIYGEMMKELREAKSKVVKAADGKSPKNAEGAPATAPL